MTDTKNDDNYVDEFQQDDFAEDLPDDQSDDWSDEDLGEDQAGAEPAAEQPKKKKSKFGTILIIAVVLIVGVAFFMFSGGSNAPAPADSATNTEQGSKEIDLQPQAQDANAPADTAPKDQGFMVDPNAQTSGSVVQIEPPKENTDAPVDMGVKAAESTPESANPPVQGAPVEAVKDAVPPSMDALPAPDNSPTAEFPTVDKILKPQPDVKETEIEPPAELPQENPVSEASPQELPKAEGKESMGVASATSSVVPQKLATEQPAATASADPELIKKLSQAEEKVMQLQKELDNVKAMQSQKSAEDIDALKARIAELQSRLLQKDNTKATKNTDVQLDDAETVTLDKKPTAVKKSPSVKPVKATVVAKTTSQKWVLKAASPNRAMVAQNGTGDMKSLHVGDRFDPIGVVTAIEATPKGWVVKGTKGTISQ